VALGRLLAIALLGAWFAPTRCLGQYQPPSDFLHITADRAFTWSDGSTSIVQVQGPLTIRTDRATMTAERAVLWLTPVPGSILDQMTVEIALLGNASIEQPQAQQSAGALYVTARVRGNVRITAEQRLAQDLSGSELYREASALRPGAKAPTPAPPPPDRPPRGPVEPIQPVERPPLEVATTQPATQPITTERFSFQFGDADTVTLPDGKVGALLWNGVTLVVTRANTDVIQLQADRVVLFTPLATLQELTTAEKLARVEEVVTAAYLEGDVRITQTPGGRGRIEQRLRASRVFYDFTTDRAVLTDAVIHTVEPNRQIPIILRAHMVRQLSVGEFQAEGTELTTSSFAVPSYSINSDRAYVRTYDTGDPRYGTRTVFDAQSNVFRTFDLPVFYWPWAAGSMTEKGFPLREVLIGSSRGFGPGVRTTWGFFESIGRVPPKDLDIQYHLDYFGDRGPAGGVDVDYGGGFVTETTREPWNFLGDITAYMALDDGEDRLGRDRQRVEPEDEFRYRFRWQHQHFFPQDWQLQLRTGFSSDPTFLEEWYERDFNEGLPEEVAAYLKRQRQTEALTLLVSWQHNNFVSTADDLQENLEVERLPELGYYRIGDSLMDDKLTLFSANTFSGLHFDRSSASYAEMGFRSGADPFPGSLPAGFPSIGTTGANDDTTYRADLRQELDYPFSVGQFRVVPYVVGRYTGYTDSPDDGSQNRVFVAAGARVTTAFWKVDNTAYSKLLDINRIRHVIEPEVNLFSSCTTVDRRELFIYDEPIDAINDVSAIQIALRQRWQTKRGGPGRWRSVDFFTLNAEVNLFANQPDTTFVNRNTGLIAESTKVFRGLFFQSHPEASIPRNSVNIDALWRVSDNTAVLADMQYNLDEMTLSTTSIGIAVQRESRMAYFFGTRYIGELNSTIASFVLNYDLSSKYALRLAESINLSDRENQDTSVSLVRKFDKFFMIFSFYYDAVNDEQGFRFGLYPEGFAYGLTSDTFQRYLGGQ
jgi:hypothetical protein